LIYLHIGLGKTGSTTLQRDFFYPLVNHSEIDSVNNQALLKYIVDVIFGLSTPDPSKIKDFSTGIHVVTNEDFVGWNPEIWFRRAESLRSAFGDLDVCVLLVFREPMTYIRSVYQQMVSQGVVLKPDVFFYTSEQSAYRRMISRVDVNEGFNIDMLQYRALVETYNNLFKKIEIYTFDEIFFSKQPCLMMSGRFPVRISSSRISNKSYSNSAMSATFFVAKLLSFIGLRFSSSCDQYLGGELYSKFSIGRRIPLLKRVFNWRFFIQYVFDRVLPYSAYQLPQLRVGTNSIRESSEFYEILVEMREVEPARRVNLIFDDFSESPIKCVE
jgi:hypothetical protein